MRAYKSRVLCITAIVFAFGMLLPAARGEFQVPQPKQKTTGYNCVFMGHSFFFPIAETFDKVAASNGLSDHKQALRKAGAMKGTPGWLWLNLPKDDEVRTKLATEHVDLLCFPYHHISGCELQDFCNWIDFARQKNPDIMVAIAIPWGPHCDVPPNEFYEFYRTRMEIPTRKLVDALREKYPSNTIFAIPHGKGVVELYEKFKAGEVPEIKEVLQPKDNDSVEAFFTDKGAHIGRMPVALCQLIWLATIYQTDVRQCKWDTAYQTDLKKMAYDIVRKDPYTRFTGKGLPPR